MAVKTLLDLSMEGKEVVALDGTELMLVEQYNDDLDIYESKPSLLSLLKPWIISGLATNTALTDGLLANLTPTINTQTGTTYTLQTADNDGKSYVRMTNAAANTVTITTALTKPVSISQRGTGTTTLVEDTGVTLNGTLVFTSQHQTKTVVPLGSGVFDVVG